MSEPLELLTKNVPHYENRSLLDDEQDDIKRELARQLQSFVKEFYDRIDREHEHGIPFNELELRERFRAITGYMFKTTRMVIDCKPGSINVQAAWIDEIGIAVIGLAYRIVSGTRMTREGELIDQYKTLVKKWFISDTKDPLIQ